MKREFMNEVMAWFSVDAEIDSDNTEIYRAIRLFRERRIYFRLGNDFQLSAWKYMGGIGNQDIELEFRNEPSIKSGDEYVLWENLFPDLENYLVVHISRAMMLRDFASRLMRAIAEVESRTGSRESLEAHFEEISPLIEVERRSREKFLQAQKEASAAYWAKEREERNRRTSQTAKPIDPTKDIPF